MNKEIWKIVWSEFCESTIHLDSLLSKIPTEFGPHAKSDVAVRLGPFLRRPWTISQHLGIHLAERSEDFWSQNFIQLKKNSAIHEVLDRISTNEDHKLPTQGSRHDFPPHMVAEWEKDWGKETTDRLCALLSQDPLTIIRMHRSKVGEAAALFPKSRAGRFSPRARVFKGYQPVLNTDTYKEGGLEIQDEGSQVMAWFTLYPETFQRCLTASPQIQKNTFEPIVDSKLPSLSSATVVDACAGGGGKTLALADILKGQARIYAYDIYERKIQALKRRASRAHETNIHAVTVTDESLPEIQKKFSQSADFLLLDSPCSGQGVLRRNPDIKWNRKPLPKEKEKTLTLEELQKVVIQDYLPLVKTGGKLIFGVCTFKKSESVDQVEWILNESAKLGVTLELQASGFVGPYETDGFFMASFIRK